MIVPHFAREAFTLRNPDHSISFVEESIKVIPHGWSSFFHSPNSLEGIPEGFGRQTVFQQSNEALFFLLYHHKTAVTYDVLGLNFGISRAAAYTTVASLKPILKQVLHQLSALPKRLFQTQTEVDDYFLGVADLSIDATEIPTQRPGNQQEQEAHYSKKKHQHSVKNTVISSADKRIYYLGKTVVGINHDYGLFKKEFPSNLDLFANQNVLVGLGYRN